MQNKLLKLYNECINELKSIGIDMTDANIGQIYINITNRSKKRYGVCKQEEPDKKYIYKNNNKVLIHNILSCIIIFIFLK